MFFWLRVSDIKFSVKINPDKEALKAKAAETVKISVSEIVDLRISKKSVDARKKNDVLYIFSVDILLKTKLRKSKLLKLRNVSEVKEFSYFIKKASIKKRPVIVGFGPAGFMAGLVLARAGAMPIIVERGKRVEERKKDIEAFWKKGILNAMSNVQFGEGGAGTFSDGKLTTGIKDPRCRFILEEFVKAGAPEEILYLSKPHIGTDNLVKMVRNIREEIISLGGEVFFDTEMVNFEEREGVLKKVICENEKGVVEFDTDRLIMAVGHSSRKTFETLYDKKVNIEQKPFSVGVRIEHSRGFINKSQYGDFAKYLPAADYKLFTHLKNGRGVYTFCMCPGGVVVGAASEKETIVTNGMSYYNRSFDNSNSAVLVGVDYKDFKSAHPLAGVWFQREIERKAFLSGGSDYRAPVQTVSDFLNSKATLISESTFKEVFPTYLPGVIGGDFREIFPDEIYSALQEGIKIFDEKIKGFADDNAVLTAPETRSSSPVRILRDDKYMSSIFGIIPCGEGCGYAGGIVSAAVDGVRCAEAVIYGPENEK